MSIRPASVELEVRRRWTIYFDFRGPPPFIIFDFRRSLIREKASTAARESRFTKVRKIFESLTDRHSLG